MARDNTRVLVAVGFAEALAAPEAVWSLVDSGFDVIALARRGRRSALRHSRHVTIHEVTAPEDSCSEALAECAAALDAPRHKTYEHRVLLPLDDSSVWLFDRIGSTSTAWLLAGPFGTGAQIALDKCMQIEVAAAAGFRILPTFVANVAEDIVGRTIDFPIILRPAQAVRACNDRLLRGRTWICGDKTELHRALSAWNSSGELLVQPYLDGTGEGVFGLATQDGVVAWSAHRRLRMMNPHGSGSSACASQRVPHAIRGPVEAFAKLAEWRGMFMVELLRESNDSAWFVEFNGRAWGSMALARRQMLEYPAWTVNLTLDRDARPDIDVGVPDDVVCRSLARELMHVLFVMRGPKSRAIRNWPSVTRTLVDVLHHRGSASFYNWRREEWRVFVSDIWITVRDHVFKAG